MKISKEGYFQSGILLLFVISNVLCNDYYETLGVQRSDTLPTIKKAFRKLALKYHPGLYFSNKYNF